MAGILVRSQVRLLTAKLHWLVWTDCRIILRDHFHPLVTVSNFFPQVLLNLQAMFRTINSNPNILFYFKMKKRAKILAFMISKSFLTVPNFIVRDCQVYIYIYIMHQPKRKFRYVEIFRLLCVVPRMKALTFIYF